MTLSSLDLTEVADPALESLATRGFLLREHQLGWLFISLEVPIELGLWLSAEYPCTDLLGP